MKLKKAVASLIATTAAASIMLLSGNELFPHNLRINEIYASAAETEDGFIYSVGANSIARISDYTGNSENIIIPGNINGCKVSIESGAFAGCTELKSVTISEGVFYIGALSFEDCINLESVYLPASLEVVFGNAFSGCAKAKFTGSGVPVYVRNLSSEVLRGFGYTYQNDMTELEKYQRMRDVAIKLRAALTYNGSALYPGDVASVLNTLTATCGGYARAYYHLGLAAGLSEDDIKVVGDCHCHAWNYIKLSGKWFNIDVTNGIYFADDSRYAATGLSPAAIPAHSYSGWYNVPDVYFGEGGPPGTLLSSLGISASTPRGDVNGDGTVNSSDYTLLRLYMTNKQKQIIMPAADMDQNGVIDSSDLNALKSYLS